MVISSTSVSVILVSSFVFISVFSQSTSHYEITVQYVLLYQWSIHEHMVTKSLLLLSMKS